MYIHGFDRKLLRLSSDIVDPLAYIIHVSANSGRFCDDWKVGRVIPAYKNSCDAHSITRLYVLLGVLPKWRSSQCIQNILKWTFYYFTWPICIFKGYSIRTCLHRVIDDLLAKCEWKSNNGHLYLGHGKMLLCYRSCSILKKSPLYVVKNVALEWYKSCVHQRQQAVHLWKAGIFRECIYLVNCMALCFACFISVVQRLYFQYCYKWLLDKFICLWRNYLHKWWQRWKVPQ